MVHLVGARGTGKDDQEVLRRAMAPRLQVELAFGVLLNSVTGLHPAAQGELSLGESQRGLGTCLKQSLLEMKGP